MTGYPSRQVHLDFHTSEHIPHVGRRFDKAQFQAALHLGRLNAINIFGKCHHSWSYYPTEIGRPHPHLQCDLLGGQIQACHEIGVRCPVYFTVGWSANDAADHPEWCVRDRNGNLVTSTGPAHGDPDQPRPNFNWIFLCPSGGYLDLILRQTEELLQLYEIDGMWYDITNGPPCFCQTCRDAMRSEGIDPDDPAKEGAVSSFNVRKWKHFMHAATSLLETHKPGGTLFFNGTTQLYDAKSGRTIPDKMYSFNSVQELEDLPTTWGGYDKFPLRAKFFHRTGKDVLGMSGKFHTAWGEFGGFKHADAIRFEAAAMVAFGAHCNFGDQLHPEGEMDLETYRLIGEGMQTVEKLEQFVHGARPAATLGLWMTGSEPDDQGTANMLLETQTDFIVVDADTENLTSLDAIVLPGAPCLDQHEAKRLEGFAAKGGGLLVLGDSLLDASRQRAIIDTGADFDGPAEYELDYLAVGPHLAHGLVTSPFLNYRAAIRCRPAEGTEVLASVHEPYFDRTYARYCSHQNTPYRLEPATHAGAIRKDTIITLPHRLGEMYYRHGARLHRDFFHNALALVHKRPMVRAALPSAGRVSLLHQPSEKRYVLHLLYATPLQRGRCLVIEDLVTLRDVAVAVSLPVTVKHVHLPLESDDLTYETDDHGTVHLTVPPFTGHTVLVFDY